MLITDLKKRITKPLKGSIHIGAHNGEEKKWYNDNNINPVIWIEANPKLYSKIKDNVGDDQIIICGVGNFNTKSKFNVANNGQSSSILNLKTHKQKHPDVFYIDTIEIDIKRMVTIIDEYNIDINNFNFLNLDIQGYELEAIKSFDDLIINFDYIYTEVNVEELYENCPLISDIDIYLEKYGFVRSETNITSWGWGDALYVKN